MSKIKNLISGYRSLISFNDSLNSLLSEQKRYSLQNNIINSHQQGVTSERYCNYDCTVSLTSFGDRIFDVALTIESIMEQTILPNRIILWLSEKEKIIPQSLRMLEKRGLEIKFCKDIRSYKKLVPSLKICPNDVIITIDDDVFYDYDVIENLLIGHIQNPNDVLAHRMHRITLDDSKNVEKYMSWNHCVKNFEPSFLNFAVGVGGVLYPPDSLDNRVSDESVFMEICPFGDDIWFKAMSVLKGTKTRSVFSHNSKGEDYCENNRLSNTGLFVENVLTENKNDHQLDLVFRKYGIDEILKSTIQLG